MILKNKSTVNIQFPIITIIYDNYTYNKDLKTAWGFACLIKTSENNILFDTGGDGNLLLENMNKLNIDPTQINIVVLSHIHGDHVGGIDKFLEKNPNCTVYLPKSFPEQFKKEIKKKETKVIEVDNPYNICKNIKSTGEMNTGVKEQSLIITTNKGNVIITGCAHPGILNIIEKTKSLVGNNILFVMGGFHLLNKSKNELENILKEFKKSNIKYVGPCHCSGDLTRKLFEEEYKEKFINIGAGKTIEIKDLVK